MISESQKDNSALLVLANNQKDYQALVMLLSKYFPHAQMGFLHLSTKYYSANVEIIHQAWPEYAEAKEYLSSKTEEESDFNSKDRTDLLIMLASEGDTFPSEVYDYVISKYNPDNFILIVNTKNRELSWADEAKIANQVNNFIEIIKENLQELNLHPPERKTKGLLTDNYEDGNIFNLLELMETTQWTNITRVYSHKQEAQAASAQQTVEKEEPKPEQKKEIGIDEEKQEYTDEQLESQMANFECMMREMASMRTTATASQGVSDVQRKRKAQDLIKKLLGGNFM